MGAAEQKDMINTKNHLSNSLSINGTYSIPEHLVHTNEPIVMSTYVGPRWLQSKQYLFWGRAPNSRNVFKFFSSCFLRDEAILLCTAHFAQLTVAMTADSGALARPADDRPFNLTTGSPGAFLETGDADNRNRSDETRSTNFTTHRSDRFRKLFAQFNLQLGSRARFCEITKTYPYCNMIYL